MALDALLLLLTLVSVMLVSVSGMPRSRSRSPLYSPSTDLCLDCPGSGSSRSEAPSRRSRTPGCVSMGGLYHTSDDRPSIFASSERVWDHEPDATVASQQLQAALVGPSTESHRDFVEALMSQVFSYNISPPLQRTLLLLYIQDHRERLQHQQGPGRLSSDFALSGQHNSYLAHSCCQVCSEPADQAMLDALFRQEMVRERTRLWRTSRWEDTLARRSRKGGSRRLRRFRRAPIGIFAKQQFRFKHWLLFWHSCLHVHYSDEFSSQACKRLGMCPASSICRVLCPWLQRLLQVIAQSFACQRCACVCYQDQWCCARIVRVLGHRTDPLWYTFRRALCTSWTCCCQCLTGCMCWVRVCTATFLYTPWLQKCLINCLWLTFWQRVCSMYTAQTLMPGLTLATLVVCSGICVYTMMSILLGNLALVAQPCLFVRSRPPLRFGATFNFKNSSEGSCMKMMNFRGWKVHWKTVPLAMMRFHLLPPQSEPWYNTYPMLVATPVCKSLVFCARCENYIFTCTSLVYMGHIHQSCSLSFWHSGRRQSAEVGLSRPASSSDLHGIDGTGVFLIWCTVCYPSLLSGYWLLDTLCYVLFTWQATTCLPGTSVDISAIIQVADHCRRARTLLRAHTHNLQQRRAGTVKQGDFCACLQISVDLSQAFDTAPWALIHESLQRTGAPQALIDRIMDWISGTTYVLEHRGSKVEVRAQRGVRQGCVLSPLLWSLFTGLIYEEFQCIIGQDPIQLEVVFFADDKHLSWILDQPSHLVCALRQFGSFIQLLRAFGLQVNPTKSNAIMSLRGSMSQSLRRLWTSTSRGGEWLRVPIGQDNEFIPAGLSWHRSVLWGL